jgi:hypothetical protein
MPLSGLLLSAFMLAVFAGMTGFALSYPPDSRLAPLVVGIPGTLLCAGQFLVELRRYARQRPQATRPEAGLRTRRELALLGWFAVFVLGILLFGFSYGAPALLFAFLYWGQSERPLVAAAAALGLLGFLHLVFQQVLGQRLFEGLLLEGLTG